MSQQQEPSKPVVNMEKYVSVQANRAILTLGVGFMYLLVVFFVVLVLQNIGEIMALHRRFSYGRGLTGWETYYYISPLFFCVIFGCFGCVSGFCARLILKKATKI